MRNEQILLAVEAVRGESHDSIESALDTVERYLLEGMVRSTEWYQGELERLTKRLMELNTEGDPQCLP